VTPDGSAGGGTQDDVRAALGFELPPAAVPLAAYQPAVSVGNLVFTAGQLPVADGELTVTGRVGPVAVPVTQASAAARVAALNALAAAFAAVPPGTRLTLVKVVVFVAAEEGFTEHARVADGASELFQAALGAAGVHARSAVGVASLPKGSPVEVEAIFSAAEPTGNATASSETNADV
jgi:enamine deaminase RidA (YjgF/YER057c/UK114 family)